VPEPTVLLLSTSDTDLITARASGAPYRWANPSRLVDGELDERHCQLEQSEGDFRRFASAIHQVACDV